MHCSSSSSVWNNAYYCLIYFQHYQYRGRRPTTAHTSANEGEFLFPHTLEDAVKEILSESDEGASDNQPAAYSTTSLCSPLVMAGQKLGSTKLFPAQNCEQVRRVSLEAVSGEFWVDPNLGCSSDAILVFCNFTSNETCIFPREHQVRGGCKRL